MKPAWATKKFIIVLLKPSVEFLDNLGGLLYRSLKTLLLIQIQITSQEARLLCICLFVADNLINSSNRFKVSLRSQLLK